MAIDSEIEELRLRLEKLSRDADEVHALLDKQSVKTKLQPLLHDPDILPEKELSTLCTQVIDSLERVSLSISPSVSILVDGFFAFLHTKALLSVVDAHVPDLLHEHGPQTAQELGLRSNIQPARLAQLMDTLINQGIFTTIDGEFSKNPRYTNDRTSELLRRDHWTQWHRWIDLYGNDFFDVSRAMPKAIKIGERRTAAQIAYGTDLALFDYLAQQGQAERFHNTLGAGAVAQAKGLVVDYAFEDIEKEGEVVIDIGGGTGSFLAALLRARPKMRGGLFDMKHVIERATPDFRLPKGKYADIADRVVSLHHGDFLEQVPPASVYTMKWCLHDWMDDDVIAIFKNVRRSLIVKPCSRFLVFESIKLPGRTSRLPRYGDLIMMITCNGRERSLQDWHALAAKGGWRVDAVYPIRRAWPCVIDLRPV